MKSDILYMHDTLTVNLSGIINKNDIGNLKRKVYTILLDYNINNVIVNTKNICEIDTSLIDNFVDDYKMRFSGNIRVR